MKTSNIYLANILLVSLLIYTCNNNEVVKNGSLPPPSGVMTYDNHPIWLPDGRTVLFHHYDASQSTAGVFLIDTSGENRTLLMGGDTVSVSDVSPDGNWMLIVKRDVYKMKINGDSLTQLTEDGISSDPSFSSDGNMIAYLSNIGIYNNGPALWIMKPDGTLKQKVGYAIHYSWYNNSSYILTLDDLQNVKRISIADSNNIVPIVDLKHVNPEYPFVHNIVISPNNTQFCYNAMHNQALNFQIFSIDIDGTNVKKLTDTQGFSFSFSPDGSQLVYCDSSPHNGRLWIMNSNGTNKRQLTFP